MATPLQYDDFKKRCAALRARLSDADFLANKGLGNEAGIFIFCYDPTLELEARAFIARLKTEADAGKLGTEGNAARLHVRNLYDILLGICDARRITKRIPALEERRGKDRLAAQLRSSASPEDFVRAMNWQSHERGDVLLICGVGEVYPFVRAHEILNAMQSTFRDVPAVLAYPGAYDGRSLSLFGRLHDGNYYRAFDLI